ncbi:XrtA system polysaccharide deacetylase [Paludisphaera soli]|uniref:XrtA system polysaccharide deacetylase n=1 Tax=Paludisphaera soli TaxID=2712865 RepID=UPI0013EDB77F|nr:XrtA system polysaccharide deacetylase [Paludisphaera soli]
MADDAATVTARPENDVATGPAAAARGKPMVLSFDVEEHHRIEAASGLSIDPRLKADYGDRMRKVTEWLLGELAERKILATFFVLGQIAEALPKMVRAIAEAGHEVASHGWDHRRIHLMDRDGFREDVRRSKDALEQASGSLVAGYRAPTFSVVRRTAWAVDVLAEAGLLYDSSIYPVRHDRYGVPDAPRNPFLVRGMEREILEIPPATLRLGGVNLPIGGGGYFRLLPYPVTRSALALARRDEDCVGTMLYFHPWEFDPGQPVLPLKALSRLRTYVGVGRGRRRLAALMSSHSFIRGVDLARLQFERRADLPRFSLGAGADRGPEEAGPSRARIEQA